MGLSSSYNVFLNSVVSFAYDSELLVPSLGRGCRGWCRGVSRAVSSGERGAVSSGGVVCRGCGVVVSRVVVSRES